MLPAWIVLTSAIAYIGFLFAVAYFGDRPRRRADHRGRPLIYALSLGVYCTSWTFFGSVGLAASSGLLFLTIYIGPALMVVFGQRLIRRIVALAKAQRITSIADFVAARYGKNPTVTLVATLIAAVGTVPYIALQLKAVSTSVLTLVGGAGEVPVLGDIALLVALSMAVFAILFGTRHVDATEHQEGLMLAIATESVVKLVAFLAIGLYVTFGLFDGPGALIAAAGAAPGVLEPFSAPLEGGAWLTMTFLSLMAILLLPRQFHVAVVENNSTAELDRARWQFPLFLLLINLFVVPVALAGKIRLGAAVDADSFVVALPMQAGNVLLGLVAFIGGLSAATAMVIVACVALSIMISNAVLVPLMVRRREAARPGAGDLTGRLLTARRVTIVALMLLAYAYYRATGGAAALASIGLLSFAALAQLAPAFFGGMLWRQASARGAIGGMAAGFATWAYTLLLPAFAQSGLIPEAFVADGPFGIGWLRPESLFYLDLAPLSHGVFWSLLVNGVLFVGLSAARQPEPIERIQANLFVPDERPPAPVTRPTGVVPSAGEVIDAVGRYVGADRAARSFTAFAAEQRRAIRRDRPADVDLLNFAERLLASAVGASSARLVLSLLVERHDPSAKGAVRLLDEATAAIQYNRDLLQTAIDQVVQGIAVFDRDLRLVCWNRRFRRLLALPGDLAELGTPLERILRYRTGGTAEPAWSAERIQRLTRGADAVLQTNGPDGPVLEVRASPMPDGGIVATFTDITERVRTEETLERRVLERTEELTAVNAALSRAKAEAEAANLGKTRFLAAAGHDIVQPLNAARLYATTLVERCEAGPERTLVRNIDAALEAVEEIIGAVLDISRLDAGALKPEPTVFRLGELLARVAVEFEPEARARGLELRVMACSLAVRSDRALVRRVLQNFLSNAIKYTASGRVLMGCRRHGSEVRVDVIDTGVGIPAAQHRLVFQEFHRLESGMRAARGLGLGLSIVERIARVLGHPIEVASGPGRGSRFSVSLPVAAALPATPEAAPPALPHLTSLEGLTVLCLDNEELALDGMRTLLSGWGCRVLIARSAADAVALIAAGERPDGVVLDYHLDDGNGLAALARIAADAGPLPALLVTADRSPGVRAAARAAGVSIIAKPLSPAVLRTVLSGWRRPLRAAE